MKSISQGMTSSKIVAQDFLHCNREENLLDPQNNQVQKAFNRAQVAESIIQSQDKENDLRESTEEEHIYESIEDLTYDTVFREEDHIYETIGNASQQKTETVFSERAQSLSIEGKFKKKDAKNIQRIEKLTQTLVKYNLDQMNFDVHFNMIMSVFKGLKHLPVS